MLAAYFDDSNTSPNQKVAAVAGYLGSVAQWDRFCLRWGALLKDFNIKSTHRTDLQALKGEFADWNKMRRDKFIQKAYSVINRFVYVPIGCALSTEDYNSIVPDHLKRISGGVYGWCAILCEHDVTEWCLRHNYKDKIQYVFEDGTYGRGQVNEWFKAISRTKELRDVHRCGGISFQTKELKPLQAADFVSYDVARYALDRRLGRERTDVTMIIDKYVLSKPESAERVRYWDRELLKAFVDNWRD